jgi:hypothetical protein
LITVGLLAAAPSVGATDYNWDGDCADNEPHRWQCSCSEVGIGGCNWGSVTNWDPDGIPGPGDNATIPAGSGLVTLWNNVIVSSVDAGSGLRIDKRDLTITGAGSSIQGLQLFSQSRLIVHQDLDLIGPSRVGYELRGPGTVVSNGPVDLSYAKLHDGVVFRNQGDANVTTGNLLFNSTSGAPTFENEGTFNLASDRDVEGSGGLFENSGQVTYSGPGVVAYLDPSYAQTSGKLDVRGGKLHWRSTNIDLRGGTLNIGAGAELEIQSPFGGPQDRRFNGISELTGGGTLRIREPMTVSARLTSALGVEQFSCHPGSGGLVVDETLTLEADLQNGREGYWNKNKLYFSSNKISGTGGKFVNWGCVFTKAGLTGAAHFEVDVENRAEFVLDGYSLMLGQGAVFDNYLLFKIRSGSIFEAAGAEAHFVNHRSYLGLLVVAENSTDISSVYTRFDNRGSVVVFSGRLVFVGPVDNLQGGVLSGGRWAVYKDGEIDFPGVISEVSGVEIEVCGDGQIPDLATMARISGGSELVVSDSSNFSVDGSVLINEGSQLEIEWGSSLTVPGGTELDDIESVVPELTGIVVHARPAGGEGSVASPPLITTPTLENACGRVLPTERHRVGTIQLVGDYIQGPDGHLHIDVSSGGGDVLQIDGNATLDGRLELNRLGEVTPGTEFTILTTTGLVSGGFAEIVAPDLYSLSYQPSSVTVTFEEKLSEIFSDGFESGKTVWWSHVVP